MSEIIAVNKQKVNLRDISRRDKVWDTHKAKADIVSRLYHKYADSPRDHKRSLKIKDCAGFLRFGRDSYDGTLHLIEAHFCHKRACPICQWRRSLMLKAKFYSNLPQVMNENPKARYIFLTLTVKNCELSELRSTIQMMNKAFDRMMKLEYMKKVVLGYCRNVEVTKADDEKAHPHFHVLLAVSPSYFSSENYLSQIKWKKLWQECLRIDYSPVVDVRIPQTDQDKNNVVKELLKYPVKEADIDIKSKWFLDYCEQVHHLRFISTGGILKNIVKDIQPQTDQELIKLNEESEDHKITELLDFKWDRPSKHYKRVATK